MAFNFRRIFNGLTVMPVASDNTSELGDLQVLSSNSKIVFNNGTFSSPLVTEIGTATLTNKTLSGNTATNLVNGSGRFNFNSTGTLTAPNATDTLVGRSTTDTLTNKSIDGLTNTLTNIPTSALIPILADAGNFLVRDGSGDIVSNTKAIPSGSVVGTSDSQTLTNKILSGNTASSLINGSGTFNFNSTGTLTAPNATDTLVARNTLDSLTNKAISYSSSNDSVTTGTNATLAAFTTGIVRLTNNSLISISGIPAGTSGQLVVIENQTGSTIVINNDDSGATASNRILTGIGTFLSLSNNATYQFYYDSTQSRWMLAGNNASAGSTSPTIITENPQSGSSYTFSLSDAGELVSFSNAGSVAATIPANSTTAFPVGSIIQVISNGASVTVTPAVGVTIKSLSNQTTLAGVYAQATLVKTATDTWYLYGGLTSNFITATGGTITTDGNFKVHTFTTSGTFTILSGFGAVESLVVGGGCGGGGINYGGGGGAGGLIYTTPGSNYSAGSYSVVVGSGGAGGGQGINGNSSSFDTITAGGGGGGGFSITGATASSGNAGDAVNGNGGGAGAGGSSSGTGGAGNGSGFAGGNGFTNSQPTAGGGGGAGQAGANGTIAGGGNGGDGLSISITGTPIFYAAGGGGGAGNIGTGGGSGGNGGGGHGTSNGNTNGTAGTPNTGSGGGGGGVAGGSSGQAGGSGVVILRYRFQ